MLKAGTLLLAYALIVCQTYVPQAAPSRYVQNEPRFRLGPVPLHTSVFSEAVKSLLWMESPYPAMTHRGCSTPSRSFCRCLRMDQTTRRRTETGIVGLAAVETHTCLLERLQIEHTFFTSPTAPTCLLFLPRYMLTFISTSSALIQPCMRVTHSLIHPCTHPSIHPSTQH